MFINVRGRLMDLSVKRVMGIINVTPDSFYSGSRYPDLKEVVKVAEEMIKDGADMLDVGGASTRPGAEAVPVEEEKRRVCSAIEEIRKHIPEAVISVDTYHASVASSAVEISGADIINDISGGELDRDMFPLVTRLNVPYIMMHMQGTPRTMQLSPHYGDVVAEIIVSFGKRLTTLHETGVKDIIIDPGFGFGKTIDHNFEILRRLNEFLIAGHPVMVGLSRKSMIWKTLKTTPEGALNGTVALQMTALMNGASILRAHDVKEAREVITLFEKIYPEGRLFSHYC